MDIPNKFREFKELSLIIVAAKRQAQFYIAQGRTLKLLEGIESEPPQYSDREGFFAKRGHGKTFGSGAVYEHRKEKLEYEFVPLFIDAVKKIVLEKKPGRIYLFAPAYQLQFIQPHLPKNIRQSMKIIKNNFYGRHPLEILEKLQQHLVKYAVRPETEEAIGLLRRKANKPSSA